MADFDYKAAWTELAAPAYGNLPFDLRQLRQAVADKYGDLHQDKTLRMTWPTDPSFRAALEQFSSEDLAMAALACHGYGHWDHLPPSCPSGSFWKFASYCDQILSERMNLLSRWSDRDFKGLMWQIHDGLLRACASTKDSWSWHEIALATEENLLKVRDIVTSYRYPEFDKQCRKAIRTVGMADPRVAGWLDKERFMVDNSPNGLLLKDLRAVEAPLGWRVKEITTVNHRLKEGVFPSKGHDRNHPFCIGHKHFTDSGVITGREAPCHICGEDLDDHISDKAALLACSLEPENDGMPKPGQEVSEVLKNWLLKLKEAAADRVEGFAFVREE